MALEEPEALDIAGQTTITIRSRNYLVIEELDQVERTRFYLVSWPNDTASVVTLDFEESVSLHSTGGFPQAGQGPGDTSYQRHRGAL